MSAIKRAIEDLAATVAEAIYTECFDMADYLEWTQDDVEEDAMNAFTTGQIDYLLEYMQGMVDEMSDPSQPDKFELTISAIRLLKAYMN